MANLETPENAAEFVSMFSLKINHVDQGDFTPNHKAYSCTLGYGDKHFDTVYQSNPAVHGEPTVTDVVQSLVADAQSYNDYRSIDDFAEVFGYSTDDTPISKILNVFNGCKEAYQWLCANDGKPLYSTDLSKLYEMLSEHEDEIHDRVSTILQEKAELEAYQNPHVPEGFISVKEIMEQFDLGDYGDQITDHADTERIGDAFTEIADGNVDLYYSGLLKWLPDNYGYLEDAENQGLLEGCHGDLIKMTQMAQYVCYQSDLYDHQDDIISYYATHQLYDSGIYMVSQDVADTLSVCGENATSISDGCDSAQEEIREQLLSHFEELYGDEELAEEMADKVIDSNFTKVNPCVMHTATAHIVAEQGYEQAFENEWEDYLRDCSIDTKKETPLETSLSMTTKSAKEAAKEINNSEPLSEEEKSTNPER